MMPPRLRELEAMAAKLSATARQLPPGPNRDNAYREIAKFRDRIAALATSERDGARVDQPKAKGK
jgi:hypothetical protein